MTDDPVHRVPTVARTGDPHVRRIGVWQLRHGIEHGIEVGHDFATPVLRNLVDELLPEAGGAARIGRDHDPPLRRPERRIPAGRPAIVPVALRSAMNQEHHRIALGRVKMRRLEQPVLHRRARSAGDRHAQRPRRVHRGKPGRILVGQLFGGAIIGDTKEFRGRVERGFRDHHEAAPGLHLADRTARRHALRHAAREGDDVQVRGSLLGGGEIDVRAVSREAVVVHRKIGRHEDGTLGVGRAVVDIEVPTVGLEARPTLGPHDDRLPIGRVGRLKIGGSVRRDPGGRTTAHRHGPHVVVRRPHLRVLRLMLGDERDLPAVRRKRDGAVFVVVRR